MAAITDVAVTGSKLLTPRGDLVTLTKIRIEKFGTTGYRIYGARNKSIVGGDTPGIITDDPTMLDKTSTQEVSVEGGFYMSAADILLFEAALDTLLSA